MNTPSRSNTVQGLSGKVTGLKFMQRGLQQRQQQAANASPSASASLASPSTSNGAPSHTNPSTPRAAPSANTSNRFSAFATGATSTTSSFNTPSHSPGVSAPGIPAAADDDEQWVLPPSKWPALAGNTPLAPVSSSKTGATAVPSAKFQHEAGWDAWLLERDREEASSSSAASSRNTLPKSSAASRRTFGSLSEPVQPHEEDPDIDTDGESDSDEEQQGEPLLGDSSDQDEGSSRQNPKQKKQFLKPGSLSSKASNAAGKTKSSTSKGVHSGKKKDEVVTARKKKKAESAPRGRISSGGGRGRGRGRR